MKRMSAVIILLLGFLGIAFFTENGGVVKQRVPKVEVLTLMHHPALDTRGMSMSWLRKVTTTGRTLKLNTRMPMVTRVILKQWPIH